MGRHKRNDLKFLLPLTFEEKAKLERLAIHYGISKSSTLRLLIGQEYETIKTHMAHSEPL